MIGGKMEPDKSRRTGTRLLAAVACGAVAALAACTYRGDIDNPATLKATWYSYLNGDDIRAACIEGAPPRYRLIYNADYDEQLRSYEVTGKGTGGAQLTVRVLGQSGLVVNELTFSDPLGFARWTKSEIPLDAAQLATLDGALQASGAFAPAPEGLQLFSKETYWISTLCRDGLFYFNAWRYTSASMTPGLPCARRSRCRKRLPPRPTCRDSSRASTSAATIST